MLRLATGVHGGMFYFWLAAKLFRTGEDVKWEEQGKTEWEGMWSVGGDGD